MKVSFEVLTVALTRVKCYRMLRTSCQLVNT